MVVPTAGAVVLVPFPFSDLSQAKLRPAVADAGRGDWILCQVTSRPYGDPRAMPLVGADFASGSLRTESYARPGKLFTASRDLMVAQVAHLQAKSLSRIIDAVVEILQRH